MSQEILKITSNSKPEIELILTKVKVIMRISDESLDEIEEELREEEAKPSPFAWVAKVKAFALDKVGKLLHKSIEYPLDEINDVSYVNGRLIFNYKKKNFLTFDNLFIKGEDDSSKECGELEIHTGFEPGCPASKRPHSMKNSHVLKTTGTSPPYNSTYTFRGPLRGPTLPPQQLRHRTLNNPNNLHGYWFS